MDGVTGSFTSADSPIGLEERFVREFTIDYEAIDKAVESIGIEPREAPKWQKHNVG